MRQEGEHPAYDPDDPTSLQMEAWRSIDTKDLKPSDLANPVVIQLLVQSLQVALARLKRAEADVESLRSKDSELRSSREKLRVDVARSKGRGNLVLLEIPIAILGGFAINMLTSSSPNTTIGGFLLGMSVVMLGILRASEIVEGYHSLVSSERKGKDHD